MSREKWRLLKNMKGFYVRSFRWMGNLVIISCCFNLLFGVAVYYCYFNQPDNDNYSTDGVTPPVLLTTMDEPNDTSVPLLANDPETDDEARSIPQ